MALNDISIDSLQPLVPIGNLSKDNIELIASHAKIQTIEAGKVVFNEGETDGYVCYLLEGELELASTNNTNFHVVANTDDARYPLAQFQPRQYTANAVEKSLILLVERALLDSLLLGNDTDDSCFENGVEVNDIENDESEDWVSRILQSPLYTNISVENIQSIFSRIEAVDVKKGNVIINQGDEGDYYYIIQTGQCRISRKPHSASQDIHLAYLREGDAFGEESIIANLKRNASVTMLSDGRLMRLCKADFKALILEPILSKVDIDFARQQVEEGAVWLDVRYPNEYQNYAIEQSKNIPLNMLRLQVEKLDNSKQYITCCDTGARGSVAAFILAQYGYTVFQLNIGLEDVFNEGRFTSLFKKEHVTTTRKKSDVAEILPFKNRLQSGVTKVAANNLNAEFKEEITQLKEELNLIKEQFSEINQIKNIAVDLEKTVITKTEKKLKAQRERINQQTMSANKLIEQAQVMHKKMKQEKAQLLKEVEEHKKKQEESMSNLKQELNERLSEEEKKMQEFYSWKANEIETIKRMKQKAEQEYVATRIKQSVVHEQQGVFNDTDKNIDSDRQVENISQKKKLDNDLKQWALEQTINGLSPINREIKNAKRKIVEDAKKRVEKSKQISKVHDQALTAEIDALLGGSEK